MNTNKQTTLITSVAALGMIGTPSAMATVVLFDDFGDNVISAATEGGAINGGFQIISNTNGPGGTRPLPGTAAESASNANIATDAANNSNSGIASTNSFSAGAATSISATWVVTSQDFAIANHNGTEFLLQSSTAFRNAGSGTQTYFQVEFNRNTGLTIDAHNGTTVETLLGSGASSAVAFDLGMGDGYSVTIDLDATSWTVTTSGLSTDATETGTWGGTSMFSDFQTDLHVVSTIQKRNVAGTQSLDLDSVSVDVVSIPEPSSTALLGLAGLALILRRRTR